MRSLHSRWRQTHATFGLTTTEAVTCRQLSADAATFRDAVEFENGVKVRLQGLEEGQSIEIVALSSEDAGIREEAPSLSMRGLAQGHDFRS